MILNKRIPRDLKKNLMRWIALFLLIVVSMFLVVSLIASADSVTLSVNNINKKNNIEDGQFSVIIPLNEKELNSLTKDGVNIEESFYLDFSQEDNSTLRVFKVRKSINLINLETGNVPNNDNEIIIEKNYASAHKLIIGDTITIGNIDYTISGIGSSPDYDYVLQNITDVGANANTFGISFVTDNGYEDLKNTNLSKKVEEYVYIYTLGESVTNDDLKERLGNINLDTSRVTDKYMKEIIDDLEQTKNDMVNGVNDLSDGVQQVVDAVDDFSDGVNELSSGVDEINSHTDELSDGVKNLLDGMNTLNDNSKNLIDGNKKLFEGTLTLVEEILSQNGVDVNLTIDNYKSELNRVKSQNNISNEVVSQIDSLKQSLDLCNEFYNGVVDYTNGVSQASYGMQQVYEGSNQVLDGSNELNKSLGELTQNNPDITLGAKQLLDTVMQSANEQLANANIPVTLTQENYIQTLDGILSTLDSDSIEYQTIYSLKQNIYSIEQFYNGLIQYTNATNEIFIGSSQLYGGMNDLNNGISEVNDGLNTLCTYNGSLTDGANSMFNAILDISSQEISNSLGSNVSLTADNYTQQLQDIKNSANSIASGELTSSISDILTLLNGFNEYYDGVIKYTDGVKEARDGCQELYDAITEFINGIDELKDGVNEIDGYTLDLKDGALELSDATSELKNSVDDLIDEYFNYDIDNLSSFIKNEENPRINASVDDVIVNKLCGLVGGVIILLLITYVISVFVIHNIDNESSIIGALYSMGIQKNELIRHYIILPIIISFVGGLLGTILGLTRAGIDTSLGDILITYSLSNIEYAKPLYVIVYGVVIPPLVAYLVNIAVINKRLSQTPLSLLRHQNNNSNTSNIDLSKYNMGFISNFRIRQTLREIRTSLTLCIGMFVSLLLLMLGLMCHSCLTTYIEQNKNDVTYSYMYTMKYPMDTVPNNSEPCYVETLKKEIDGYNLDVTLMGIDENNPYFNFDVTSKKNFVTIGSGTAYKYNLAEGDNLILNDDINNVSYVFTIDKIVEYSIGLHVFMNIDNMRELFNQEDDYYNVLLSNEDLNIDTGRIYSCLEQKDIINFANIFMNNMQGMIYMLIIFSVVIFIIVMYLMMKVMLDRSTQNISLFKVFGFNDREIKKLYIDGNFFTVLISSVICVPLTKQIMEKMYPSLVSNVAAGFCYDMHWKYYVFVFALIFFSYFIVNALLVGKIKKISLVEILKNRE